MTSYQVVKSWNEFLAAFPATNKDVYFTENYVRLYENDEQEAVCFVYQEEDKTLLFPYLRRAFFRQGERYFDFETAYGYGGPITNTDDTEFSRRAMLQFVEYGKAHNYVAGFVRFHPALKNEEICREAFRIIPDRHTVAIDLSMSEDEIWMNEIHTKNRNVIRKGAKEGLTFIVDDSYVHLQEFIRLYNSTMDKLGATDFYYFKDEYYARLVKDLPESFLGVVKQGDQVLSSAIFMYSTPYGHYHLSGSDKAYLRLSPNNFMLWEAAKELKRRGCKVFHLGGGTTSSPEDSLFCFKSRFSKSICDFSIGKIIFNEKVYGALCEDWNANNPDKAEQYKNFLLKYKY